jgi:aspartyl-tRNA(Asn)/glutamyl-tRNA(Gln) amidotransferase subunit A
MDTTGHISSSTEHPTTAISATWLAAAYRAGTASPDAVCDAVLTAIRAVDDPAIFTVMTEARARAEAAAAAMRWRDGRPKGPLDGVPVAWKDLFDLRGLITTAGSRVLADRPPASIDAPVVARLAAAGMVCVGRTNMTEFAFSGIGINPHYGTPRNPHGGDIARIPGGSSSGSAVAVARGLVPIAIGTDTGGSVRIPAALNGIVGFKASGGRYPMEGVFPLARSLDTLGVFCRSTEDAVLVDAAMQGLLLPVAQRRSPAGVRLIVPDNVVFDSADSAVAANCAAALERLARAGVSVERRKLPVFDDILALIQRHGARVTAEAYHQLREWLEGPAAERMDRRVVTRALAGAKMTAADYCELTLRRREMIEGARPLFDGSTFVAHPTVPHVAPSTAALENDFDLFVRTNALTLRNTMLGNFLDWCGVSIPTGTDKSGLPTALLISGGPGGDDDLMSFALGCESEIRGDVQPRK